jgi:hypothetical protein
MPPVRVKGTDTRNLLQRLAGASKLKDAGTPSFSPEVAVRLDPARDACLKVLREAGDSSRNDPIDARVREEVISLRYGKPIHSPREAVSQQLP